MPAVTSTRDPRVREAAVLARRRERRASGRHLVEGPNAVAAALSAGVVEIVFATADARPAWVPAEVEVVEVVEHVLDRIATTTSPQGIVAVARDVTVGREALPANGLVVVLGGLGDPGNVGTIVRTADAAGAAGVVCTHGTADVLGPKAVRAAAGSTYHLPLVVDVAPEAVRAAVGDRRLLGLDATASRSVASLAPGDAPLALVLGSEAHGLDPRLAAQLDGRLRVPILGAAESLNVAAAAAVAIYAAALVLGRDDATGR